MHFIECRICLLSNFFRSLLWSRLIHFHKGILITFHTCLFCQNRKNLVGINGANIEGPFSAVCTKLRWSKHIRSMLQRKIRDREPRFGIVSFLSFLSLGRKLRRARRRTQRRRRPRGRQRRSTQKSAGLLDAHQLISETTTGYRFIADFSSNLPGFPEKFHHSFLSFNVLCSQYRYLYL